MLTIRTLVLALLIFVGSALACGANDDKPSAKRSLGTIYLDETDSHSDGSGMTLVGGKDVGGLITKQLQLLGFEVVSFQGVRPKSAKLSVEYAYRWERDATGLPYVGSFNATLLDQKHVIGRIAYHAPALRERGEKLPDIFHEVIGPAIIDLMNNFQPNRLFPGGFDGPEVKPTHPSELLPRFSIFEANKINKVISSIKYPITRAELIERIGGEDRIYLTQSATLQTADHAYGVVDYALTAINHRQGYFFLELMLEDPPKNEKSDKVKAVFLMFYAHGIRFAQAPDQPIVFKKRSIKVKD